MTTTTERVTPHAHAWNDAGECRLFFDARRLVRCHARRCRAPGCNTKRNPPGDYCREHIALARRLIIHRR